MPQITLDLDDETAAQLDAICDAYHLTPSLLARRIVRRLTALLDEAPRDPSWAQRGRPLPIDGALEPPGGARG